MAQLSNEIPTNLASDFKHVREATLKLFQPLKVEDAVVQSNVFGSPPNWHIAHVTWFFQMVLERHEKKILAKDDINLDYLNSYYQRYGHILPKPERGKYPRPTVDQTLQYRSIVDSGILSTLNTEKQSPGFTHDILLAMQHELQHQELMVYDFQNYFERFIDPSDNYVPTTMRDPPSSPKYVESLKSTVILPGGIFELGFGGSGFCYDNELPQHKVYLEPYEIDMAPVTNGDFAKFIEAGGYKDYKHWLADGWDLVQHEAWNAPLYWRPEGKKWIKKDFLGVRKIDPDEPVVNVSFYEADAYSKWAGKRLPTEAEWEKAASWDERAAKKTLFPWGDEPSTAERANLLDSYIWSPTKIGSYPLGMSHCGCHQMIGDVWEWTSSEYVLYPGYSSRFPEYTDKWAINQKVLRGGSFATPVMQIRSSYRNYFKPHERIPFAGFRCARDSRQ